MARLRLSRKRESAKWQKTEGVNDEQNKTDARKRIKRKQDKLMNEQATKKLMRQKQTNLTQTEQ